MIAIAIFIAGAEIFFGCLIIAEAIDKLRKAMEEIIEDGCRSCVDKLLNKTV